MHLSMLEQIVRALVRLLTGVVLGIIPGALYAGMVSVVHLGVSGRLDRVPVFTVGCVLAGGLLGLLGGMAGPCWATPARAHDGGGDPVASRYNRPLPWESAACTAELPGSQPHEGHAGQQQTGARQPASAGSAPARPCRSRAVRRQPAPIRLALARGRLLARLLARGRDQLPMRQLVIR
jgi:hypothetical protein